MPATLADIQRKYGESVYPLYKDQMHEPYMENDNGVGYHGVVMYDELEDKVQCAECGKWFTNLGSHLSSRHGQVHGMGPKEYRSKYGILNSVPLCGLEPSKKISEAMKKKWKEKPEDMRRRDLGPLKLGRVEHKVEQKKAFNKVQFKNRSGLCDAQITARLIVVRDQIGGKTDLSEIGSKDIIKHDPSLWKALSRKYGNIKLAVGALGLNKYVRTRRYSDAEVIAKLRNFVVKNHRVPSSDNNVIKEMGVGVGTIYSRFGSWRRAVMMAGLDQLLAEIKEKDVSVGNG